LQRIRGTNDELPQGCR